MVFFLILLLLVINNGLKFSGENQFNPDYLNRRNTTAVNGIFVILIVFSHYSQYADFGGVYDAPYLALKDHLNQMVVATFWFYSGYGMMEAVKKTNGGYIKKLPSKFWQLLLRMDVAVVFFCIMNMVLGIHYSASQIALSFICWSNVGNSNWYIFAILVEYILMYVAFIISEKVSARNSRTIGVLLLTVLTVAFVYILMKAGRPVYTYNTIIILPFGAFYSECRERIEGVIQKNDLLYLVTTTIVLGVYTLSFFRRWDYGIEGYTVWALSFTSLIILLTMKISVYNPLLEWFGKHIFSIYILQRIPMIVLYEIGFIESHKYMSLLVVFAAALPLALAFEELTNRLIVAIEKIKHKPAKADESINLLKQELTGEPIKNRFYISDKKEGKGVLSRLLKK